jgi:hypothetical protein
MALRNSRKWALALLLAGIAVPLAVTAFVIARRVVVPLYEATRRRQPPRDLPVTRYASSEAVLASVNTNVSAIERIRPRIAPGGDLVLLASRAQPVYSGSLYLQLAYFLAPRSVALLYCGDQPGLLVPMGKQKVMGGLVYQDMEPPARFANSGIYDMTDSAAGVAPAHRLVFVSFTKPVAAVQDWTQFCR